jgi:hypothetical protein
MAKTLFHTPKEKYIFIFHNLTFYIPLTFQYLIMTLRYPKIVLESRHWNYPHDI